MIITVMNHKGGVAKTTTVQALGLALQSLGYKVLLIDLDGQASLSKACDYDKTLLNISDVIGKNVDIENAIQRTMIDLIAADEELYTLANDYGKIGHLKIKLSTIKDKYDYIIIDTAPASNTLSMGALFASDKVIVPVEPDIMSIEGVYILSETVNTAKAINENLDMLGILVNQFNKRQNMDSEALEVLKETSDLLDTIVFDTKIRKSVAIREAQAQRLNMFEYASNNNAVKDYMSFAKEVEELTQ